MNRQTNLTPWHQELLRECGVNFDPDFKGPTQFEKYVLDHPKEFSQHIPAERSITRTIKEDE
jgi:hypothetical protein